MALYVNTNATSLSTQNYLNSSSSALDTIYQRLSSGLRINSAKDDAAGLQISNRMTSQINGLTQANRNANDGIALAQTVEGAMDEMTTMLQRIRTLAVQAANGTNTDADRQALQEEVTQLSAEITRIACKTTYNGSTVLNGTGDLLVNGAITLQIGAYANDTLSIDFSESFTVEGIANQANQNIETDTTQAAALYNDTDGVRFSVSSYDNAQLTISAVDEMLSIVDSKRAELGAAQTRLESTINNQSNIITNTSDARSRIRDADYAEETANLTTQSIIQQASAAMLVQANSRPQLALSLLGTS